MSSQYPNELDTFANPIGTDLLENANNALDHDRQHSDANDAIEALEAKVGINGSAVTSTHDYKLSSIPDGQKALSSGTSTQSITGLTLVNPIFTLGSDATGDMFYRNSGGLITRLPIGTTGQIIQASASGIPEYIANPAASAATYTVSGVSTFDADARYYAADAGANDTYVITLSPAPAAYAVGQTFRFKANTANTGAATLNINSLGAVTIVKGVSTTLADGDIAAGQINTVVYDGTNFVLQSSTNANVNNHYTSGVVSDLSATSAGNNDVVITTPFAPKIIKLHYFIQGNDFAAGGNGYIARKGTAIFNETTLVSDIPQWHAAASYFSGDDGVPTNINVLLNIPNSTSVISVGADTGGIAIKIALSIQATSANSFTIRRLVTYDSGSVTARCKLTYEAFT